MKKQFLSLVFFCSFTFPAVAQDRSLSKEKFREKILQAIPSDGNFIFLDTASAPPPPPPPKRKRKRQ